VKIDRVIVNASPLIVLFKARLTDLLPRLFDEILVPAAVWNEVIEGITMDAAAKELPSASWAIRVEVSTISPTI
jgi:predicted nucleic acid-binding protein